MPTSLLTRARLVARGAFRKAEAMSDLKSCVDFLQRLIRTEGLPGNEGETAELVQREMEGLGYREVHRDDAGNVLGKVPGRGEAPSMMFNTHLDHVDVGEHDAWPHPPFGGEVHDDRVWGRGAVDIKGPLACQVYGVARLLRDGFEPAGDIWVTGTVQEEVGGLGARHMAGYIDTPLVVIGEPSRCELRRGHRGRTELIVHAVGRSEGVNALDPIARLIARINDLEMRVDADLGTSTCVPSLIRTDQRSPNVVPGEVWLTCDWRNVPGESGEEARDKLQQLADLAVAESRAALGIEADAAVPSLAVEITPVERASFSGMTMEYPADNPAYIVSADHPALAAAKGALDTALARDVPVGVWQFATDGGHFSLEGMVCIGFGPGDDLLAHTVNESIPIADLDEGLAGNEALARALDARLVL
jgi:putative selenium metabolism hydrolase